MSLDPRIKEAITKSVLSHNQSLNLAEKIIAWLENLVDGNVTIEDKASVARYVGLIYEETQISEIE